MEINLKKDEIEELREKFEKFNTYSDLYKSNKEFKEFVDKNCKNYELPVQMCLLMKTVQEVGEYYLHKNDDKIDVDICPCGIEEEDKSC